MILVGEEWCFAIDGMKGENLVVGN